MPNSTNGNIDLNALDRMIHNISDDNAQALEDGLAELTIKPVMRNGQSHLVLFVNGQPVYTPKAPDGLGTYSACLSEALTYMNSY